MARTRTHRTRTDDGAGAQGMNLAQGRIRKAFTDALIVDARLLDVIINNVQMCLDGDQVHALEELERKHVAQAVKELRTAQSRMRKVGRRG